MTTKLAIAAYAVEVVGQREAVALGHLENFMLAVAVEGSPVDKVLVALGLAPVKHDRLFLVADLERTALVVQRQADDEGAELIRRARGINVGLEFAAWA